MSDNNNTPQQKSPSGVNIGVQSFVCNPVQENTYVIWDETGECAIIDAGCYNEKEFLRIDSFLKTKNLKPVKLINTHCHFDHIMGITRCRLGYKIKWEAHIGDRTLIEMAPHQGDMFGIPMEPVDLPDIEINEGDEVKFGNSVLKVYHVPGHSPGSICLYEENSKILFTGDVLFRGSIGRTDLPGGDFDTLIHGIKSKLLVLPDNVTAYPGHGPATTIGDEKARNPFLQ